MNKMSIICLFLIISSIVVSEVRPKQMFCDKKRDSLLYGVFNYEKIIFASSWNKDKTQFSVWIYEIKANGLIPNGEAVAVDQIFPVDGILLRGGFGLTKKCPSDDNTCKSYRELVFIFFQGSYKVFRLVNNRFTTDVNKSTLPFGLHLSGPHKDWYFRTTNMINIDAIMLMTSGDDSQLFVVSNGVLYSGPININAEGIGWDKLAQSEDLKNAKGGIVIGSHLFINTNDNTFLKYDGKGTQLEKISVWKFFGCDKKKLDQSVGLVQNEAAIDETILAVDESNKIKERNNNLAAIIIVCVVVVVVLTNIIAGLFWISVYRRKSNTTEN